MPTLRLKPIGRIYTDGNVKIQFPEEDLKLSLQDFVTRYIEPAFAQMKAREEELEQGAQ
jgi:hypothetical protein